MNIIKNTNADALNIEGKANITDKSIAAHLHAKYLQTNLLKTETIYNENGIFIHGDLTLGNLKTHSSLKTSSFISNGESQWYLISHEDFDNVNFNFCFFIYDS